MSDLGLVTAVASAVMAGVFLAFSSFVMTALGNIHAREGIRAMQRINVDVFCWSFSLLFFGIPIISVVLGIYAVWHLSQPESTYYLVGSIVYLLGCLVVTVVGNVPLNNSLACVDPDSQDATDVWEAYLVSWTRWNHVRVVACLAACIVFVAANYR